MTKPTHHSISVAGVVVDEAGRVLMVCRRDNGHWEPPGGVLELGETFEAGVRREVLEETGVEVTVGALTGVYKNMTQGIVGLVFRCAPHSGVPGPTEEAEQVAWLDPASAVRRMAPAYAIRVRDALSTGGPAVRVHDGAQLLAAL